MNYTYFSDPEPNLCFLGIADTKVCRLLAIAVTVVFLVQVYLPSRTAIVLAKCS